VLRLGEVERVLRLGVAVRVRLGAVERVLRLGVAVRVRLGATVRRPWSMRLLLRVALLGVPVVRPPERVVVGRAEVRVAVRPALEPRTVCGVVVVRALRLMRLAIDVVLARGRVVVLAPRLLFTTFTVL
jgi:hypothetical protein